MLKQTNVSQNDIDRRHDEYDTLLPSIQITFDSTTGPLFTTTAVNLWEIFLGSLPLEARQHYTCKACQEFVERFGGLVRINPDGTKVSAIWGNVPEFFQPAVGAMLKIISKSKVSGVFVSSLSTFGRPLTPDHKGRPDWHHMSIQRKTDIWYSVVQTASQREAEYLEEFKMLIGGLREYPIPAVDQALKLLRSDSLYRSERVLGVAEWLKDLHEKRSATRNSDVRTNLTWLAVATAPASFCHVKNTMIGTLLDDIVAGMDFNEVSRRFASKMHPLQYQRPQVAPSAGNIAQAEKLVQQLGVAPSLERRFARLEELRCLWKPVESPAEETSPGVFSHLQPKNGKVQVKDLETAPVAITWEKFQRTVLPDAISMDFYADGRPRNYSAITTAAHDDAPPILQWDSLERRNPFSGYVYHGGSLPVHWGLLSGWVKVNAVCYHPSMWQEGFEHLAKIIFFILDGARDTRYENSGNGIFPETLKAEFHGIRAVVEAYSKHARLSGYEEASACGVRGEGASWDLVVRVKSSLGVTTYRLDRWD